MQNPRTRILIVIGIFLLGAYLVRDYLVLFASLAFALAFAFLPLAGVVAVVMLVGYGFFRTLRTKATTAATRHIQGAPHPGERTKELADDLAVAFNHNNMRRVQQALAHLPPWPITQDIQQTAQALAALKRSIYRAQAEGVPATMVARYLHNMNQAADTVWQLASKVDAVGLQNISYQVVAPRLAQEAINVQQLQQAINAAHEGIALLILAGTKSDALQDVEDDLRALTHAVTRLEAAHPQTNRA